MMDLSTPVRMPNGYPGTPYQVLSELWLQVAELRRAHFGNSPSDPFGVALFLDENGREVTLRDFYSELRAGMSRMDALERQLGDISENLARIAATLDARPTPDDEPKP